MKFQFYHSQVINTCLLRHWLLMQLPFIRGHPHVSAWMCCCSETQEHGSSLHGAWINFVIHKMVQHWVLLSYRVVLGISAMSTQTYHWWNVLQLGSLETNYTHLTSANTVSEDSDGDGAMTTRGSPNSTSSHSIWLWRKTGQKHLKGVYTIEILLFIQSVFFISYIII